jgi:hypothetical protein
MSWSEEAKEALRLGQKVEVKPRGHSMTGRIQDGALVTLEPCRTEDLAVGDIVLVRIQGKRFSHVVLHSVLSIVAGRFLIGSHRGRVDGWVDWGDIYGVVTEVEAQDL